MGFSEYTDMDEEEITPEQQAALYENLAARYPEETPMDMSSAPAPRVSGDPSDLAAKTRFHAALGGGLNTIASAWGGQKIDNGYYDQLQKDADIPVKRAAEQEKMLKEYLAKTKATELGAQNRKEDIAIRLDNNQAIRDAGKATREETFRSHKENEAIRKDEGTRRAAIEEKEYGDKMKKAQEEREKPMLEIETRARTIKENIDILKRMIKEKGTYEATGAHNDILNSTAKDIAVDLAKLKDPTSSAMTGEVERELSNLVQSGMMQRNSTALESLDALESRLQDRVKNAYEVRKLTPPQTEVAPKPVSGLSKSEADRLIELEKKYGKQ